MEYKEPIPDKDYKVLVRCFTFNHSKYIEDALNGFVMQKTNFPYICTIVDDCSTDGEQEVIKAYLNKEFDMSVAEHYETEYAYITIAPHKTNSNCAFAVYFLKYNHYSKKLKKGVYLKQWRECCPYEALCEGDDYWIAENKLQKQVDFMDNNSAYSLCCHSTNCTQNEKVISQNIKSDNDIDINVEDIISHGGFYINTCSLLYRIKLADDMPHWRRIADVGDHPLCILLGMKGKVRCLAVAMSCYRVNSVGSWSSRTTSQAMIKHLYQAIIWLGAMNKETCCVYEKSVYKLLSYEMFYHVYINDGFKNKKDFIKKSFETKSLAYILCVPIAILFPNKFGLRLVSMIGSVFRKIINIL